MSQGRGIEASKSEDCPVTGTVRAKRSIGRPACIRGGMAVRAGCVEDTVVQADPVRVEVRTWLRSAADLDAGDEILRCGYDRNGVTNITFQADSLLLRV